MTTRKPNKTKLEFSVEGNPVGELTMRKSEKNHTQVYEGSVVNRGTYSLSSEQVKDMVLNRLERDYPRKNIKIDMK